MGDRLSRWKNRAGTVVVLVVIVAVGFLVFWNMFGQGPYRDSCSVSLGCRSYLCLEHGLRGDTQVPADGRCTKTCSKDSDCGGGDRCVKLDGAARDDLPPFGKPERACMRVLSP